jgi:hypothetical protein
LMQDNDEISVSKLMSDVKENTCKAHPITKTIHKNSAGTLIGT